MALALYLIFCLYAIYCNYKIHYSLLKYNFNSILSGIANTAQLGNACYKPKKVINSNKTLVFFIYMFFIVEIFLV